VFGNFSAGKRPTAGVNMKPLICVLVFCKRHKAITQHTTNAAQRFWKTSSGEQGQKENTGHGVLLFEHPPSRMKLKSMDSYVSSGCVLLLP
jgi:hypothetical protein